MKILSNFLKLVLLPACLVVVSGCGGGGGVTDPAPNPNAPVKPVITSSASVSKTGQSINFSGSSTTTKNLPLTYSWDFGDGTTDTVAATSHTYSTKGTYTVTLTVTNTLSLTAVTTSSIKVYAPPTTPTITPSVSTAGTGQSISFTGSSTDPNGLALTYSWNFGDGATGTGAATSHTYSANGLHTVTLTVTDSAGLTASATSDIQIYAPPTTPTISSSATLVTVGHYYSFTGTSVNFSGSSTDPNGLALTYAWNFGDGGSDTGATTAYTYAAKGIYTVTLTVTNSVGVSSTSTVSVQIYAPPSTPTITPSISSPDTAQTIIFTGTATDPNSLTLTYAWNFGDGGTATGINVAHAYAAVGTYTVTLTITNSVGLTSFATKSMQVYARPVKPSVTSSPSPVLAGQSVAFTGTVTDPDNRLVTYAWNFGDSGTGTGKSTSHTYAATGMYTVTFTVTDVAGITASTTYYQSISSPDDNTFIPDCTGTNCSASNSTTYTGSGTGVWRYNNTTGNNATIDISIDGVLAGKTVTMLFSNGTTTAATTLPATGVLATPVAMSPLSSTLPAPGNDADDQHQHDSNHLKMLMENLKLASDLSSPTLSAQSMKISSTVAPPPPPMPTPAIGDTRNWKEFAFDMKSYSATVKAVCTVPTGRNVVIWVDSSYGSTVFDSDINTFATTYCGSSGGYARLATLLGDAWGAVSASQSTYLISDSTTKQDINIVIVAATTNYGGYFWSMNNRLSASYSNSNEALVFFINANGLHASVNYYMSALLHESTHMINFYQRSVLRSSYHDTWLEETSAMMAEDIVTPAVLGGYNTVASVRVPGYVSTGGAVSYVSWPQLSSNNYAMGGSFGGYLNRRYGISIFEQLITNCNGLASYTCVDNLIKSHGGPGYAMDFARFGASIFAGLPAAGMPTAYAYPAKSDGGYSLAAINVSTAPATATALSTYTATTHTYNKDTVASGHTSYVRTGVVVPANTTLIVVVK